MNRSLRCALTLLSLAALALFPASSFADTVLKSVDGTIIFANGSNPTNPGNCSAVVFAQWKHVPNTVYATASTVRSNGKTVTQSAKGPNFHDVNTTAKTYIAPAGNHWIVLGANWGSGAKPCDGSQWQATQRASYPNDVKIDLTLQGDAPTVRGVGGAPDVGNNRRVEVATIQCPKGGNCTAKMPSSVVIKCGGGKKCRIAVDSPFYISGGRRRSVFLQLSKKVERRLEGKRIRVKIPITATNLGVFETKTTIRPYVDVPA